MVWPVMLRRVWQTVPSSHPGSNGSDDAGLPSFAKYLSGPSPRNKSMSKVNDVFESDKDSEELAIASRAPLSGPYITHV